MSDRKIKSMKPGWRRVKFGEVVRQCKEKADPDASGLERYVAGDHMDTDDLRLRRWGEIGSGYLGPAFHIRFKPGQVLYGSRRTYLRKVAVADFEGICANTTFVLEPKNPDELLPGFLPLLMQTEAFNDFSVKNSKGSVNPYINFSDLEKFEFLLPPPEEQRLMVGALVGFASLEDEYEKANQCTKRLLDSHANAAFSKKQFELVPFWKVLLKQPQSGLYKSQEYLGRGAKFVNMKELFGFDEINDSVDMARMEITQEEAKKYSLTSDDLLFGRRSIVLSGAGKCSWVANIQEPVVFESSILRVTVNSTIVLPKFLFEWLRSPQGVQQITRIRSFTTVAGIAGSDLRQISIPVMPIKEQVAITSELAAMRSSIAAIGERQAANRVLKKTVFERVLEGCDVY